MILRAAAAIRKVWHADIDEGSAALVILGIALAVALFSYSRRLAVKRGWHRLGRP